jgi:hypothetical protein
VHSYEVYRAMQAGVPAENISLSTQELPPFFDELVNLGVKINACSLSQLERFGKVRTRQPAHSEIERQRGAAPPHHCRDAESSHLPRCCSLRAVGWTGEEKSGRELKVPRSC